MKHQVVLEALQVMDLLRSKDSSCSSLLGFAVNVLIGLSILVLMVLTLGGVP